MDYYMKDKTDQYKCAGMKKRMCERDKMVEDTFTPEGVPVTSPLDVGMKGPQN